MNMAFDPWMKEFNEASNLSEEISEMIAERGSFPPHAPDTQRHLTAIRRKITILHNRLESLESLLSALPSNQSMRDKEFHKRQDMLANIKAKANQMSSTLNIPNTPSYTKRMDLLGGDKQMDAVSRTAGLDNSGIMGLQRQIMKEQDEGLEMLAEAITSTKHIALAVNEELSLHTRLIDDLDEHVDVTDSKLQIVQKRLTILNKRAKGCSCMSLLLSTVVIVILVVLAWLLIKYL